MIDGEAEQGKGGGIHCPGAFFVAIPGEPGAICGLGGKQQLLRPAAGRRGMISAALIHALGVVVGAVEEPGLGEFRRGAEEPVLVVLAGGFETRLSCMPVSKKALSERDVCTKYITPAIVDSGWDVQTQVREEVHLTKGRVIVRGRLVTRGKSKFADYVLYHQPNLPLAIVEAKDNNHSVGDGLQQALEYAETIKVPFVFSSNGDGFWFHDSTGHATTTERQISLDECRCRRADVAGSS